MGLRVEDSDSAVFSPVSSILFSRALIVVIASKDAFQCISSGLSPGPLSLGSAPVGCYRALLYQALYHAHEDDKIAKDGHGKSSESAPTPNRLLSLIKTGQELIVTAANAPA